MKVSYKYYFVIEWMFFVWCRWATFVYYILHFCCSPASTRVCQGLRRTKSVSGRGDNLHLNAAQQQIAQSVCGARAAAKASERRHQDEEAHRII